MLGVIGNKFSIGKETYQPYAAELHYFRVDKRYWSICFERIKRAGFRIISTTVPWNVHQEDNKFLDFSGHGDPRKDLIVFLELAREFAFKVILRPGPLVSSQVPYGGLPRSLFNDIKLFARDASGMEVKLPDTLGIDGGYLPSYLHPNFQFHLKNYFKTFIEITKNYVHPRGPIFMVELDYETSFGRQLDPASADYNPEVLLRYYGPYLEGVYGEIKKLNSRYHEKNESFQAVEPPRKFSDLHFDDYPKVFDWFRFREHMLGQYLEVLEDVFKSYTVEPLFFRSLYFGPGELIPSFNLVPEDRAPFLGANIFPEGSYFDLSNKARFLRAEYSFAYATSFSSGAAAADPVREAQMAPITDNTRRFYLTAGLSSGLKGMNHYMFVDRDYWYGAPLHKDGTVSDGYETAKNFNLAISTMGFDDMEARQDIAVLVNRMYYWISRTSSGKEFKYVKHLMNESASGFCRDLMRLKLNYGIRENRDFSNMTQYKMLFIPTTEVMPEKDQTALVELAKAGVTLVLCGLMPRFDEQLRECQVLANHFRIKTTEDFHIGTITHKHGSFPSYVYGSIRTSDDAKCKKLVTEGTKVVGVCSGRFKGALYLFSYDLASGGNHQKLSFIDSVLAGESVQAHLYCSDPSADISFQHGEKKGFLFVVIPPAGELSVGYEARHKEIIIRLDLKELGFSAAQVKLTNILLGDQAEPIKTTAKDLKEGIPLTVSFPDGMIYLVEKR